MSMGFEVYNADGETMADNRFPGFSLLTQNTFRTTVQTPHDIAFPTPVRSLVPPIIAVQVQQFNGGWLRMVKAYGTPGNWTGVRLVSARLTNQFPAQVTWHYRVYAAGLTSTESYGIRVTHEDGTTTFDSGFKQLVFDNLPTQWADWPVTTSRAFSNGREHNLISTFVNPNLIIPSDAWVALSLANTSMTTVNTVIGSGKVKYLPLYSEITYVWQDSQIVILTDHLCLDYPPQNFNIPTNIFCPIIPN